MEKIDRDQLATNEEEEEPHHDAGADTDHSSVDMVKYCEQCNFLSVSEAHQCHQCFASLEDTPCVPVSQTPGYLELMEGYEAEHEPDAHDISGRSESSKAPSGSPNSYFTETTFPATRENTPSTNKSCQFSYFSL